MSSMNQVTIYREAGRFAGWPANYGMWSWGDELVLVFTLGYLDPEGGFHARDRTRAFIPMQARSLDGGETWAVAPMDARTPGGRGLSDGEHLDIDLSAGGAVGAGKLSTPAPCPGGIDFAHPDFAMMCARSGLGGGTTSWFYVSLDRCHSWRGPYALPMFGQVGIEARTDVLVTDTDACTLFLTAARPSGGEGGGVMCVRTEDGGKNFEVRSWVATCEEGHVIMPSSVRLPDGRILTALRRAGPGPLADFRHWIDLYASDDDGLSWDHLSTPVADAGRGGNPPAMVLLDDGRLCLVSGFRSAPFEVHARVSDDGGETWSHPTVLRSGAGNHDIGYPRAVQRADGRMVAAYYFNDDPEGERYIGATIWRP